MIQLLVLCLFAAADQPKFDPSNPKEAVQYLVKTTDEMVAAHFSKNDLRIKKSEAALTETVKRLEGMEVTWVLSVSKVYEKGIAIQAVVLQKLKPRILAGVAGAVPFDDKDWAATLKPKDNVKIVGKIKSADWLSDPTRNIVDVRITIDGKAVKP